ncbi:MAG TPA: sensor histidine kinase, partial [Epulopiscium sp.]|nr:sensor histidine kinase [Candidatus Epulonipiscium sp.]
MSDYKEVSPSKIKSKMSSSLVLKLNAGVLWRLIVGFFSINMLLVFISFFLIFWKVEQGIYTIINIPGVIPNNGQYIDYPLEQYEIRDIKEFSASKNFLFFNTIQKKFPLKIENAKRNIIIDSFKKDQIIREMKTLEKLDLVKYRIEINRKGSFYQITYSIGSELRLFLLLFLLILAYELLIIIGNLKKGARRIGKTLKPLSDLAETAKSLHAEVAAAGLRSEGRYIKDLAGVISSIDANKLDSQISVDSSQNELKD